MAYIISCGAATPVGRSCPVSIASARAGIARLTKHHSFIDKSREPVTVGMAQYINEYIELNGRISKLTNSALKEAISDVESLKSYKDIPLIIALPEQRPGLPEDLKTLVAEPAKELAGSLGATFNIEFIEEGHSAGLLAVKQAETIMEEQNRPFAIVGGVDCYFDLETMDWLEERKRLFVSYYNDGFIPGEGAAFCVMTSDNSIFQTMEMPITKIKGIGTGEEPRPHGSELTTLGEGLSCAVDNALQNLEDQQKVDQIFYGMNGESFHALEFGYTLSRYGQKFNDIQNFVNWTRSWGDLGAASALVSICCIIESAKKNYLKGPLNMVLASSLGNQRAAAILETVQQE